MKVIAPEISGSLQEDALREKGLMLECRNI